jgi:tetratricopeptide (TPR) repeat protein
MTSCRASALARRAWRWRPGSSKSWDAPGGFRCRHWHPPAARDTGAARFPRRPCRRIRGAAHRCCRPFWPVGVYNTLDLARTLDLPVGTAWIERFCPRHAEAFDAVERAESQAWAGLLDEAVHHYEKSLDIYPTATAWYGLGAAAARQRDFSLALSAYSNAIALDASRLQQHLRRDETYKAMMVYASMQGAFTDTVAASSIANALETGTARTELPFLPRTRTVP